MNITSAVRVIQGQDILPDGSTLEEQGITDGSTVNIIIEPVKEIHLHMSLGSWQFTHKVYNSVRTRDLKQQLIDGGTVGLALDEFQLLITDGGYDEIRYDTPPNNELLPLHLCEVGDNTRLRIIGGSIIIQLMGQKGNRWYKTFPRKMKISEMKQALSSFNFLFPIVSDETSDKYRTDVMLFLQTGNGYRKLEGEAPIGSVLSENDIIHFIEDRFYQHDDIIPVYFGHHPPKNIGLVGYVGGDTIVSIKLRFQGQMGFPVFRVDIKQGKTSLENDSTLQYQNYIHKVDLIVI